MCNNFKTVFRRLWVVCIVFSLLAGIIPNVSAEIELDTQDYSGEKRVTLVDMNKMQDIMSARNVTPSSRIRGTALFSARWANHTTKRTAQFSKGLPTDFTAVEAISFQIYSATPTPEVFVAAIYSPGSGHMYYNIPVDWTGWKEFNLSLTNDFRDHSTTPLDRANVTDIRFISSWYGNQDERTELYIDSIYAIMRTEESADNTMKPKYTEQERKLFNEALSDGFALLNFAENVYNNGKVKPMMAEEDRLHTTTDFGVTLTPAEFFIDFLGVDVAQTKENIAISFKEKQIILVEGELTCTVNGEERELSAPPVIINDKLYLPVVEICQLLGKSAETFSQLTIIGSEETIDAMRKNPRLVQVGGYLITEQPFDLESVNKQDFIDLKAKARKYLVGDETNDMSNEWIRRFVLQVETRGQVAWNSMNKGNNIKVQFGNGAFPTTTAEMTSQYGYLHRMALAYGTYGSELYKNPALRQDIFTALEWLYDNLYGDDLIKGKSWRDIHSFNWWDWYVGVPAQLMEILVIMEPEMWQADIDKYIKPYDYIRTQMRKGTTPDQVSGRVYYGTLSAILQLDAEKLLERMQEYEIMLTSVESGVGVQSDWLYITHKNKPYSATYGVSSLLDRVGVGYSLLAGSKFEVFSANKYNIAMWMYNMFEPIMYKAGNMIMFGGRNFGRGYNEQHDGAVVIASMLDLIGSYGRDDDYKLKQIIKRHVTDETLQSVLNVLNISQIMKLYEVLEDSSVEEEDYQRAHVYHTGDRVVQHRNGYAFGLSMSSERVPTYESINQENKKGWYTGDGMLYMYLDNDVYQYGKDYRQNADMYLMPGTTVDTQERKELSINQDYLPKQDFVGAVSLQDQFATAAMSYEAYHNDVEPTGSYDDAGGKLPLHDSTLTAKKAWFMLDDEVVALGTDINADDGFPVHTVVENRRLIKTEKIQTSLENRHAEPYEIKNVFSAGDDGNVPENVLDGTYDTRWSLEGLKDSWIQLELNEVLPIGYMGVAVYNGQNSPAIFELRASEDGQNWTTVFSGQSSGTTPKLEAYDMQGVQAKYIRLYGYGRTTGSAWNSYTRLQVYPPSADGSMEISEEEGLNVKNGTEIVLVDGKMMSKDDTYELEVNDPKWVHVEGNSGYYFPNGGNVTLRKYGEKQKFLSFWMNHGVSPSDESYAYVLLPHKDERETAAYAANPDIEILSNTAKVQAVTDRRAGLTGIVFWEAGSFNGITVSHPMIVMLREEGEDYRISLCDPTQKLSSIKLTIDQKLNLISLDNGLAIAGEDTKTIIEANVQNTRGKSFEAEFSR